MTSRIRHNDYGHVQPPHLGAWVPELSVTIVIPAHGGQDSLDRTLAGLAAQTYPPSLLDVVVADDGSDPPLRLAPTAPARSRIVRVGEGWGRGAARQAGALAATGDVIHWLDSDMILAREHVEAHMRWHHLIGYAVVIGDIKFVTSTDFHPDEGVAQEYTAKTLESTRMLKDAGMSGYLVHTGATTSVSAALLRASGGVNPSLNMAEDTELGYRLSQAGAVFIPEPEARSWHVGESTVMRRAKDVHRHNWSFLGDLIPDLRWLRSHPRRQWLVPYVRAVVEATSYEDTRATVDSLLAGTITDVAVTVVAPWGKLTGERRSSLDEPLLDLRLTRNLYEHEPRVTFAESAPTSAAPTPYLLTVPSGWVLRADTLAKLIKVAEQDTVGLVCAALTESATGVAAARLERTAAYARARFFDGEPDDLVDELYGSVWISGGEYGFADEAEPLAGDPAKWRAVAVKHQEEIKQLQAEVATLRAQLAEPPPEEEKQSGPIGSLIKHLRSAG